ncbi:hypothetical protein EGR_01074 [Echinococcus granulosus]|uniref:Uncharacterized protein n=1 Tax=Echinococcus granulosus TaxID=6210 RepID=W6UTH1_ECHGR|nr:hypothetical protein EGR_01074 [Echinococcus granulosus]EUB63946.1 hypothetical protein EGR_01074 [Echinococcus granulosus]
MTGGTLNCFEILTKSQSGQKRECRQRSLDMKQDKCQSKAQPSKIYLDMFCNFAPKSVVLISQLWTSKLAHFSKFGEINPINGLCLHVKIRDWSASNLKMLLSYFYKPDNSFIQAVSNTDSFLFQWLLNET